MKTSILVISKTLQPQLNHQTHARPTMTALRCSKWPCGPWNTQGCLPILKLRVQRHSDNSKVTEQREAHAGLPYQSSQHPIWRPEQPTSEKPNWEKPEDNPDGRRQLFLHRLRPLVQPRDSVSKHCDPEVTPVFHPEPGLHPSQICPKSFRHRNHDPGSCGDGGPTSPQPVVTIQGGAHPTSSSARGS